MNVSWIHRDRCTKCGDIIWTQEDDVINRPSYNVQCYCGDTFIKDNETVKGGGGSFTEKEFKTIVKRNNPFPDTMVNVKKK